MYLKNIVCNIDIDFIRILGSVLLIIGYFLLLYIDVTLGCILRLLGNFLMIPFSVKIKTWDVLVIQGFFSFMDLSKIIEILI